MKPPVRQAVPAKTIGRASALIASGTLVSRGLGFVKAVVLQMTIGTVGGSANAFANANQIPNNVYAIVAGGVLSAILVPQVVKAAKHEDGGQGYVNRLVTLTLSILAIITIIATAAAPIFAWIYGTGLPKDALALATAFAFWCMPQIFFYGMYTILGEVLNARGSFGPYTWAACLNNVVAMIGLGVFSLIFGADPNGHRPVDSWSIGMIAVLAGSATLGVAIQALILFVFWRRVGLTFRPDFHFRGVGLGTAGKLATWTFGMLALSTLAGVVQVNVANLTHPGDASNPVLQTAWLLFILPHSIIALSVGTVYFQRMATHARDGDRRSLVTDFSQSYRIITLAIAFCAVVFMVAAIPISRVVVSGDYRVVSAFGAVLIAYCAGLVPFCALFVVQRVFYALEDTRTPFLYTVFQSVLVVAGSLECMMLPSPLIATGLATTMTVGVIAQCTMAYILLRRKIGDTDAPRLIRASLQITAAAAIAALVGVPLVLLLGAGSADGFAVANRFTAFVTCVIVALVMGAVYFVALRLMRSPELGMLIEPFANRLGGRFGTRFISRLAGRGSTTGSSTPGFTYSGAPEATRSAEERTIMQSSSPNPLEEVTPTGSNPIVERSDDGR